MNRMINAEEDVKLLRQSGIFCNHLENHGEVVSLWNSMGKCVKLTKVRYLDNGIKDVNGYSNSCNTTFGLHLLAGFLLFV